MCTPFPLQRAVMLVAVIQQRITLERRYLEVPSHRKVVVAEHVPRLSHMASAITHTVHNVRLEYSDRLENSFQSHQITLVNTPNEITEDSFLDHLKRNRRFGAASLTVNPAERMPELARAQAPVRNVHAEDRRAGINRVRRSLGFLELGDPVFPCLTRPFTTRPHGWKNVARKIGFSLCFLFEKCETQRRCTHLKRHEREPKSACARPDPCSTCKTVLHAQTQRTRKDPDTLTVASAARKCYDDGGAPRYVCRRRKVSQDPSKKSQNPRS